MQNGRLRRRFVRGVDYIKFEVRGVHNVLGSRDVLPGSTFLHERVKRWYFDNWGFITEGNSQGGVEITLHYGENGYDYQNVFSAGMINNMLSVNGSFPNFWKVKYPGQDSFYWWHFAGPYDDRRTYFFEFPCCEIIIAKRTELKGDYHTQSFLASTNLSHCFFQPIMKWAEDLVEKSQDKGDRTKRRYRAKVKKIQAYMAKYKEGVPEEDLQSVANDLKLDISITLPLYGVRNKNRLIDVQSKQKRLKHFKFQNTRFNHLDLQLSAKKMATWKTLDMASSNMNATLVLNTAQEMRDKLCEISKERLVPVFVSNSGVVQSIIDVFTATKYELKSPYNEAVAEFENKHNLSYNFVYATDGLAEKMISAALHYSSSAVDFNNPWVKKTTCFNNDFVFPLFDNELEFEPEEPSHDPLDLDSCDESDDEEFEKEHDEWREKHEAWKKLHCVYQWCQIHKLKQFKNSCAKGKKSILHIDQSKAYFNFKMCPFYDGLLGRWSDCRVCEVPIEDAIQTTGFYLIDQLDYTQCKFPEHVKGFICYKNKHLYAHCEIKFMHEHLGLRFKIIAGVWGPKMDLEFPESMKGKMDDMNQPCCCEENNKQCCCVSHYSKWCGRQGRCSENKKLQFLHRKNNHKLLSIMSNQLKQKYDIDAHISMNDSEFVSFSYPKPKDQLRHRKHIAAYITAYCRITTIMQTLEVKPSDLIRVHADGMYIDNSSARYDDIRLVGSFRRKEDRMGEQALVEQDIALSSFIPSSRAFSPPAGRKDEYLKYYDFTYLKGAGGTGKTYQTLRDEAYGRKVCYAPHSNKLCADTFKEHSEFMKHRTPYSNILRQLKSREHDRLNRILSCNHILADEVSFWTHYQIKQMFQFGRKYHIKITFAGDIGYQVPPCIETNVKPVPAWKRLALFNTSKRKMKLPNGAEHEITTTVVDWATYIHNKTGIRNYRFKDDKKHCDATYHIRDMMDRKAELSEMLQFLKAEGYRFISKEQMYEEINIEDTLLCSEHDEEHDERNKKKKSKKNKRFNEHNKRLKAKFAASGDWKKYRFTHRNNTNGFEMVLCTTTVIR